MKDLTTQSQRDDGEPQRQRSHGQSNEIGVFYPSSLSVTGTDEG